ncbi:hypothetical protein N7493_001887 [Penicillium malachiteum]|uniref:F-box domain-containing protein n=1 Tax=Penicillium malachiteum TaxID=1324776 RepID=A0AAD6HVM2_9EURO|nr:hypothetical protein N7493_001887 [Penicillium malachiteum]
MKRRRTVLLDLPSEIHFQISSYLLYPDALALKHTCRHFYSLVYTGVHLKVDWLVQRFERKLECPMEKCSFRTDEVFCNNQIRRIMERRRWHLECRPIPGGCWVIEGQSCSADLVHTWMKRHQKYYRNKWVGNLIREALAVAAIAIMIKLVWLLVSRIYSGQKQGLLPSLASNIADYLRSH